jgi:hypothetical protein
VDRIFGRDGIRHIKYTLRASSCRIDVGSNDVFGEVFLFRWSRMVNADDKCWDGAEAWLRNPPLRGDRISIHFSPGFNDPANRITLSDGTRVASMQEIADQDDRPAYEQGAMLPREPWRPLTGKEAERLIVTEVPRTMATSVAVVKLPGDFSVAKRDDMTAGAREAFETSLVRALRTICELPEPFHCIGPNKNPANLTTVTVNHRVGRYNGLHVDNWDQLGVNSLHTAMNRVCVNIGQSDRYFLFLPLSLMDIVAVLAQEMGPDWQIPRRYTMIGRKFMERFPEIPVVRCRLAPGEAYIAPTENLVHDASSAGQSAVDEQFTIRGHITLL